MDKIEELYQEAIKDYEFNKWLIILIEFLVNEKKVLHMSDGTKELDRYFLPKNQKRMNQLLSEYERGMNNE